MRFPYNQEHLFVTEGQILSGALYDQQQYELAQALLDQALGAVNSNSSKALLYKEKAYLCKQEGKTNEAMEFFEKAIELEESHLSASTAFLTTHLNLCPVCCVAIESSRDCA